MTNRQRLVPLALRYSPQREPPPGLLPAGARRPAAIVAVACLLIVAVLGIASAHQGHGDAIDRAVDSWVIGLRVPLHTMLLVSRIGGVTSVSVLTAALALACIAARRITAAVLAVAGVALASALTEFVLKPLVHRTMTGFLVFPSGHTTGLFALAAAMAVILLGPASRRPRSALRLAAVAAVAAAVIIACVVGLAMVGLHYHYFTDAIGGAAVGTGVVIGAAFLLDLDAVSYKRQAARRGELSGQIGRQAFE